MLIEDNPQIAEVVTSYLERDGYQTRWISQGSRGLEEFYSFQPDLVILDLMLPDLDGYSICREIRKTSQVAILMLSARDEALDKILGLEVGADDYLSKPFHPPELLIRVKGLLRRCGASSPTAAPDTAKIVRGELLIEPRDRRALLAGQALNLTRVEYELLLAFASHPGQVLSREQLLTRVWGHDCGLDLRTVDTHLRNLRAKLRAANPAVELIRSIRGVGYRLD